MKSKLLRFPRPVKSPRVSAADGDLPHPLGRRVYLDAGVEHPEDRGPSRRLLAVLPSGGAVSIPLTGDQCHDELLRRFARRGSAYVVELAERTRLRRDGT